MPPRASVVTTVYNGSRYLPSCVESVLEQTLDEIEMIVFDDGSTDGTGAWLEGVSDPRVRVISRERVGRARALNMAVAEARADYVAILDSDDLAAPQRLERQVAFLDSRPECGLVASAQRILIDAEGGVLRRMMFPTGDAELRQLIGRFNPFNQSSVTYRRSALESVGGFDERLGYYLDWDLSQRIAESWRLGAIDEIASYNRVHPGQFFEGPNGVYSRLGGLRRGLKLTYRGVRRLGAPSYSLLRPFARLGWSFTPEGAKRIIVRASPRRTQHWRRNDKPSPAAADPSVAPR